MIHPKNSHIRHGVALIVALAVSGCAEWRRGMEEALGWRKPEFNEAAIVSSPPLTVPPDFALRAPVDGAPPPRPVRSRTAAPEPRDDAGLAAEAPSSADPGKPPMAESVPGAPPPPPSTAAASPPPPPDSARGGRYGNPYAHVPPANQAAYRKALEGGIPGRPAMAARGGTAAAVPDMARGANEPIADREDAAAARAEKVCRQVTVDVHGRYVCRK